MSAAAEGGPQCFTTVPTATKGWEMTVRAEHESLTGWLRSSLSPEDLRHVGLVSLNQWPFMNAVVAEVALAAQELGSVVTVGMWADDTPLPDPGWTTSRRVARLVGTRSLDERVERALTTTGLPQGSISRPPIRRWTPKGLPPVPDPATRVAIRQLTYLGSPMGRSILQVHPDTNTSIREDRAWPQRYVQRAVRSYAWVYDQVSELIRRRDLTTLVVYNGRFTHDQAAAAAAAAAGIKVLYFDAGGLDTGFDLTFAPTHDWVDLQRRMLELWAAWPETDRDEIGTSWFINRQEHREPGLHVFVELQERGHLADVPESKKLVAFFSSSPDEIAELDLKWEELHGSQPGALAVLADAVREEPGAHLVVRTHPHMRLKPADDLHDWQAAVAAAEPAAHYDASDSVDSYALMRVADVVVTYGSTAGVEAAFLGKPVVVLGPAAYDLIGCATRASTPEQVRDAVLNPIAPDPRKALPYGLMMQRRGFNFERVQEHPKGTFALGQWPLSEARPLALNISNELRKRRTGRLLARETHGF